jgi:DNA-directed RNA polymerase omega subunit
MSGTSNQAAIEKVHSYYDLVLVAAQRTRELRKGSISKIKCNNKEVVTALTEIEQGYYTKEDYLLTVSKSKKYR